LIQKDNQFYTQKITIAGIKIFKNIGFHAITELHPAVAFAMTELLRGFGPTGHQQQ
jgi:hypothetical protein